MARFDLFLIQEKGRTSRRIRYTRERHLPSEEKHKMVAGTTGLRHCQAGARGRAASWFSPGFIDHAQRPTTIGAVASVTETSTSVRRWYTITARTHDHIDYPPPTQAMQPEC